MRIPLLLLLVCCSTALGQVDPCVFCDLVQGKRAASFVYRNDKVAAFLDHAPLNPGHTLIVPVAHYENLLTMPDDLAGELMKTARRIGTALQRSGLRAEAVQLQMNNGDQVARQKHAHLHVWPRYSGDFPESAGERLEKDRDIASRAELDAVARKLRTAVDLGELYSGYYQDGLKLFPMKATFAGDHRYNDQLPNPLSEEHRGAVKHYYRRYLDRLRQFDRDALPPSEQIHYDVLEWQCANALAGLEFPTELMPLNQMSGWHLFIPIAAGGTHAQPFKTVRQYDDWLKRLDGFTEWCDSAIVLMRRGIAEGHVLPRPLTEKVIPQLIAMASGQPEKHHFYRPIELMPPDFSPAERDRLARAYAEMIRTRIIPAFAGLHAFMVSEYLPASRSTSGINDIPRGKEYYAYQIRNSTTLNLTPDEIHEIGLREVARITSEMEQVKRQAGFNGTLQDFLEHVRTRKELMPYSNAQQVLDHFAEIHHRMQPALDRLFNLVPKTPFEVRRTEAFREKSAAAQYMAGSLDGTRPGIFYVPIPDVTEYNNAQDEALFLHEAIPGHHYQISLQRENQMLPEFRKTDGFSAYTEGWALYCESLGRELGLYEDPYQYFGMLSMEMHRAIRLVVDTGIHSKGWTREQAIEYSLAREAESESGIVAEIERYMAWPGQALAYKIGQLKIRELRERAEAALGNHFYLREFHDEVLKTGSVPLPVLERAIDRWIADNKN